MSSSKSFLLKNKPIYLLMFELKVNDHPWKLPDGRETYGWRPVEWRTFSSFFAYGDVVCFHLEAFLLAGFYWGWDTCPVDEMLWWTRLLMTCFHRHELSAQDTCLSWSMKGGPFAVIFDACIPGVISDRCAGDLSCLHMVWTGTVIVWLNSGSSRSREWLSVLKKGQHSRSCQFALLCSMFSNIKREFCQFLPVLSTCLR